MGLIDVIIIVIMGNIVSSGYVPEAASGSANANVNTIVSSPSTDDDKEMFAKEKSRYGTVDVQVSSLSNVSRRGNPIESSESRVYPEFHGGPHSWSRI